ncbi:M50 family metallopeptidase [Litorimonas sp. RW-G-Af-16]|uniref:M50 family metallopeptidase n=1 Tax=Litorimonas sp. RW-G-Af-16 TaxID=3241168 RepID=UPI00390CBF06
MLSTLFNTLLFITSGLLVLSFLVFFHELGHYSVARFFNVAVERFSIGFGKPIAQWTAEKTGVRWSIGRIPLGGYVKFKGDAGAASNPDAAELETLKSEMVASGDADVDNIFHFKPLYQRVLIVLAGPVANFLLAIIIFAALALGYGSRDYVSEISVVTENSRAAEAGFLPGDKVITMDGKDVSTWSKLGQHIALRSETDIVTVIERDGMEKTLTVRPKREEKKDFVGGKANVGHIGIGIDRNTPIKTVSYNPIEALGYGVSETGARLSATGIYLGRIFTGRESGDQLGSVVKIATITGKSTIDIANADITVSERASAMLLTLLSLGASISIALGFANLMPIPALDGGHLLYYGYEAVAGRPLSQKKQEFGFRIGFAILLTLFVVLTINDIGYVSDLVRNLSS